MLALAWMANAATSRPENNSGVKFRVFMLVEGPLHEARCLGPHGVFLLLVSMIYTRLDGFRMRDVSAMGDSPIRFGSESHSE
jgi:hypothetical protein